MTPTSDGKRQFNVPVDEKAGFKVKACEKVAVIARIKQSNNVDFAIILQKNKA